MQSVMELINVTLYHADKSHSLVSYDNIGLSTNFSFTYYPKFWVKNRPTFSETLRELARVG